MQLDLIGASTMPQFFSRHAQADEAAVPLPAAPPRTPPAPPLLTRDEIRRIVLDILG